MGLNQEPMALQSKTLPKTLLVATKNKGKAREFADLLGAEWRVETLLDRPELTEGIEDGVTFQENAAKKAVPISLQIGEGILVLADDSGLEVDFLNGAPGVYSARYAGEPDPKLRDGRNNAKLLTALAEVPPDQRGAQFRCSLALALAGKVIATADGVCRGRLLREGRGEDGFGYDPLFVPDGSELTFSEMPLDQKHRFSHRGKALAAMAARLREPGPL